MKTLKVRIKDNHAKVLIEMSHKVNFVWNYVNELSFTHWKRTHKFFSAYDICNYTAGSSKLLGLHSQTIQAISEELVARKKQHNKLKLNWRVSNPKSKRHSLGWIPFKRDAIKYADGWISYFGHRFKIWDSYGLSQYNIRTGSFIQDSRGRWYACLDVKDIEPVKTSATATTRLDLSIHQTASTTTGLHIDLGRAIRKYRVKLEAASKLKNRQKMKRLNAKISNIRKDLFHKFSSSMVKGHACIIIGPIAKAPEQIGRSKGACDAGWYSLINMLRYKCDDAGVWLEEASEETLSQVQELGILTNINNHYASDYSKLLQTPGHGRPNGKALPVSADVNA